MAYVFLNDGGPEAEDYDSNYFYFNDGNPEALASIEQMLASSAPRDAAFRSEFDRICQASFDQPVPSKSSNQFKYLAGAISLFAGFLISNFRAPF